MPKFTIRRKKKQAPVQPEPKRQPVEEKIDENEVSMSESDEEFISESMEQLKLENRPQNQPNHVRFQSNQRPQFENRARPVQRPDQMRKYLPRGHYQQPEPNPYYRHNPTPYTHNARPKPKGRAKLRYRSLYGAGGDSLPTQAQAQLLYDRCFA